ncbi:dihydroorotate dehydrogenase electron transfer subunit [Candidatus Acetothermia bacterium]|nr:dihydroorotate dehydrogenase electron transfer subunit [Candidatus Acetothermia bacterium]MCI2426970.1 dihydroorotate dehydrogenase electron transfer subunit [Candidatus Acetothermia bacterium]MCI2428538.1 dihydroorotate dehydrogenase electron transfer subunit [Candidatus Acetothermia bacterium]
MISGRIIDRPRIVRITAIRDESPTVKTLSVIDRPTAERGEPGEFLMVWIPGCDEIPLSISSVTGPNVELTVVRVGEATTRLHALKIGDQIGLRGPYGQGFSFPTNETTILVGGGYGIVPLRFLFHHYRRYSPAKLPVVALGAKTATSLLFIAELNPQLIVTEDGTAGKKGLISDFLPGLIKQVQAQRLIVCGPQEMVNTLYEIACNSGIPIEASLEEYMRCGIGLCGSCVKRALLVCNDGPVFTTDKLALLCKL